jgi:tetratricopeptide (TPR) repeat protein
MKDNPYRQDKEEIRELLRQFENLKAGRSHTFLDEESFEKIIDHYDDVEDLQQAFEAADIAVDRYPYSAMLHVKKGDILIATRRYHEALKVLNHAQVLDQNDINLYILKTDAYLALDQQEKAVELLEHALTLFEGEERIELLFELADVYDDYEEFDKIFDCLKIILEEEPTNEEALYKICFWTDFTGRNEESIRLHQQIIDEFPYNELAWFNLGASYQGLKLYEKAIDAYQYAVVIDEKFDYAYRNMGDAYIRLRKFKEAIEVLQKVLELSRPEDVIYEAIGHCFDRMKNFAQARFYYRKASHLNQEDSKLYYKVACTYMNEEQWSMAIKQLEIAMQIHRGQPEFNMAMGECKMQLGDYKDAIQNFSAVVRQRPKNISSWEALIRCLYAGEFYEEALEQIDAALIHTDHKPVLYYYQSAVLFAMRKSKQALVVLEKALNLSPKLVKRFIELDLALLQRQKVVELISRFRKGKTK